MHRTPSALTSPSHLVRVFLAILICLGPAGCKSWFDQSEVARERGDRLVVPILKQIDPLDEAEIEFAGALDVKPDNLKVVATDYVIGPNDLLAVSIFDLAGGGVETVRQSRVSETGLLSLPMLGDPIKASGVTEQELQKAIAQKYKDAELLQNARVSVTVIEARQRTFSVMGGIQRPGQYAILEADFRIINALIQAGGETTTPEYLYIIRKLRSERPATQPAEETAPTKKGPTTDILAPQGSAPIPSPMLAMMQDTQPASPVVPAAAPAPATRPVKAPPAASTDERIYSVEGKTMRLGATQPVDVRRPATAPTVRIAATQPVASVPTQPAYEFGSALKNEEEQRVIRVPLQLLKNGDLRYNIVIRPYDTIIVPIPVAGFYYIGAHVGAPALTT